MKHAVVALILLMLAVAATVSLIAKPVPQLMIEESS
jgi:hypothetical protein